MGFGDGFKGLKVCRVVGFHGNGTEPCNHCFDFLIRKHGSDAAPARLFVPYPFAARIIPGKVQTPEIGVFSPWSCSYNRDVHRLFFVKIPGQGIRHLIGVIRQIRCGKYFDFAFNTVNEDYRILVSLTGKCNDIKPGELFIRAEIAAYIGVDGGSGKRGNGRYNTFAAPWIPGGAAQRPCGNADGIFRIIPGGTAFDTVPHVPQIIAFPADKFFFYGGFNGGNGNVRFIQMNMQRLIRISLGNLGLLIRHGFYLL